MMLCNADMPSYTFAMKAQKLLGARGYFCEIKRLPSTSDSGCGYYISVSGDCSQIENILKKYSVPFENLRKELTEHE